MSKKSLLVCLLSIGLLIGACSGNGGTAGDGGLDGDGSDTDGSDPGGDPGTEQFQLRFEPGATGCARFMVQRTAPQELLMLARIDFAPGTLDLAPGADREVFDLVERVQIGGPNPVEPTPTGPGVLHHEHETALWGHCDHFTFQQPYTFGNPPRTLVLEGIHHFCTRDGVADEPSLSFTADELGEPEMGLVDAQRVAWTGTIDEGDYFEGRQLYGSCSLAGVPGFSITARLANGDSIRATKRYLLPVMGTGPAGLVEAQVELDGQQRTVTDYFHLAYGADLHNFNERFLVVLDPPIGQVHGLAWSETGVADPPATLDLLRADLEPDQPLEQRAIVSYEENPL